MVILVTGASGQLGQALQFIAGKYSGIQFHFCSSSDLDITKKQAIEDVFKATNPNFCVNAAAYTAVDKAESEPEKAHLINVDGAKNLAETCKFFNTTLIHVSTDFVFDGYKNLPYTEIDHTNPRGIYGKTKREGEQKIAENLIEHFIIRTSWLYSQFGNNFMKTMLRLAQDRDSLSVVNDQIGTPTNAIDLAEVIIKVIFSNSKNYGIYHFSNEGSASWYDFAKKIFEINQVNIDLKPILTSEFPTLAQRPKYSVLNKSKIKTEFKITIDTWEDSLVRT
ncbi:dTDP-4-dehydrorhamnose reductase [Flavobacterium psychrotolerans]|uniref:dTDP-4-dehydrorhamnose reductase n=1 Tax=Flavobacterium psychrotolerans TaxID=2169410 RepID=A0A2U1JPM2_9FLAO|nr:dTDP-4-dehydrorhamnose reductase [Flavobacterium psychrotolerans]PWA06955.1 dTDP-4-dehydrorhamnose reductase [Flavobacterium psychrotolerans]